MFLGERSDEAKEASVAEKICPECGAKMIKYSTTEDGKPVTKWVCSMGFLCRHAQKLKQEMDGEKAA